MRAYQRWKPGLPKTWLYALSGVLWCGVGLMLLRLAWMWSGIAGWTHSWPLVLVGVLMAHGTTIIFTRMLNRNMRRLAALPAQAYLFTFQS